ncbi:hypothetical protein ACF0H5_011507 [Mactra antiquata]
MRLNPRRKRYFFVIVLTCSVLVLFSLATEQNWNCESPLCLGQSLLLPDFITKIRDYLIGKPYKLEIICMVLDRTKSLKRLLDSLNEAVYDKDEILLSVWIDRNKAGMYDYKTYQAANTFIFKHGDYKVNIHKQHVGLYGQWLKTYDFKDSYSKAAMVVFLEDDITVSPFFYKYLKIVHSKYDSQSDVNGYALQGTTTKHASGSSDDLQGPKGQPVFKYPTLGTWGFSPNMPNWEKFLIWYDEKSRNKSFHPYVPFHKSTEWYKAHEKENTADRMWSIWHVYYAWLNKEYTIYSNFPNHQGLTTNWQEDGLHFTGAVGTMSNPLLTIWTFSYDMLPDKPVMLNNAGHIVKRTE